MNLKGKSALVTGSSRSIGRAIAMRLARDGALVAVHYVSNREAAEETQRTIEAAGGECFLVRAEMGDMKAVRGLAADVGAELIRRTGSDRLDILVNNAAIVAVGMPEQAEEADFDRVLSVNLKGPMFLIQAVLERMSQGGRIINISSSTTLHAFPHFHLYTAAKAGLNNLTANLAKHLGPRGITVNVVAPGVTDTDMNEAWIDDDARRMVEQNTPMGRIGQPDDIADVVAFLASDQARWVTGQYISANGGLGL